MSFVGQSPRERGSPVRRPWSPPPRAGAYRRNRPTRSTTLHDDRDEQPSQQGRAAHFLHVPHLSQYNSQAAGTPRADALCQHNLNFGTL